MKKLFALLFLLFSILGCQPSNYFYQVHNQQGKIIDAVPIYLDEDWNKEEVAAIEIAINDWNAALNGQMVLEVRSEHFKINSSPDPGLMIVKTSEKSKIAHREDTIIALAWFDRGGGKRIYMVRDRLIPRGENHETEWEMSDVSAIVRHEIGHSLGSRHIKYDGLMAPIYDRDEYKCIDEQAALAVATAQHLSSSEMKYCK